MFTSIEIRQRNKIMKGPKESCHENTSPSDSHTNSEVNVPSVFVS